jgi:hypothetical protein
MPQFMIQNKINALHIFHGAMQNVEKVFKVAPAYGTRLGEERPIFV